MYIIYQWIGFRENLLEDWRWSPTSALSLDLQIIHLWIPAVAPSMAKLQFKLVKYWSSTGASQKPLSLETSKESKGKKTRPTTPPYVHVNYILRKMMMNHDIIWQTAGSQVWGTLGNHSWCFLLNCGSFWSRAMSLGNSSPASPNSHQDSWGQRPTNSMPASDSKSGAAGQHWWGCSRKRRCLSERAPDFRAKIYIAAMPWGKMTSEGIVALASHYFFKLFLLIQTSL